MRSSGEDHHTLPGHDDDHARRELDGLSVDGNGGERDARPVAQHRSA